MSVEKIKELFRKCVEDSLSFHTGNNSSVSDEVKPNNNFNENHQFNGLKEADVGVTEYLSDCGGFSAVMKQRFSDFHVHEIDKDGNVVYFTNTEIPVVKKDPVDENVIAGDIWEKLKCLEEKVVETVEIDVTDFSKEKRKCIHEAIKSKYGASLDSNTTDGTDGKKLIIISRSKNTSRRDPWFSHLGRYLYFVLFKQNMDTVDAINFIASKLKTKASNLTYAGTKDKRGTTSQLVSMGHLDAKRLNDLNKCMRNVRVGNFVYKNAPLKLGNLKGNLFEIALRNVTESDEVINKSFSTLKENGFINYFGLQRFGNCAEIPTHEIGKFLIKGDFKTAVELILKPRQGKMSDDLREARRVWWNTRDADKAYKCLSAKKRTIEGELLLGLAKHGKNAYVNALDSIPRNLRLLYLHAYQSIVWNKVLSKRIKQFGNAVLEGDLIIKSNDVEVQHFSKFTDEESHVKEKVQCVSKEELGNIKITDIVHPLPGYSITYPNNIVKQWYDELLREDNITLGNFNQTVKKYSLSGAYRPIVKKVNDLSWRTCYYSEPEEDLILSDLDKLDAKVLEEKQSSVAKYKAVILKFSLDSSTYATMALREALKIDTSCSNQAALNSYSNKRNREDTDEKLPKKKKE